MMLRLFLTCLFLILINQLSFGQENMIYLKSGAIETAQKVDIIYNPTIDDELSVLNNDGQSKLYKAAEVDSVLFGTGQKYYTKSFQFYYDTKVKSSKITFVRIVLNGAISLYENEAFGNNMFLEKDDEFFQLNKPTSLENNELIFGQVKLYVFQECLPREDILEIEFIRNVIVDAVNEYNKCININYVPRVEAEVKRKVKSLSVYFGKSFSSYNFIAPVVAVRREGRFFFKEGINTEGSKSEAISLNIEYLASVFRSQWFYYFIDLGYTEFDYALYSDDFSSIQNINFTNVNVSFGPAVRLDFLSRISSFTQFGPTFNFSSPINEIAALRFNNESVVVIPENSYKEKRELLFSIRQAIDYNIRESISLSLRGIVYYGSGRLFRKDLVEYYNDNYSYVEQGRRITMEESVQTRYLISIGLKYSLIKKGVF